MKKFSALKLSTLIDIHADFTDYYKRMLPGDAKTQEFEDFRKAILLVQDEIEHRQVPLSVVSGK